MEAIAASTSATRARRNARDAAGASAGDGLPPAGAVEAARSAGLVYVRDGSKGFRRVRRGESFDYVDDGGARIVDDAIIDRIHRLAIPPAYDDVWICANARGHLQATGRDARGRKQYRYHPEWRSVRDHDKFGRMAQFGAAMPRIKRRLRRDLAGSGVERRNVLAAIVGILLATWIRVGNASYARANRSYGLTTLRNRHLRFGPDGMMLKFAGKGGRPHDVAIDDRRLVAIVRRCHQLPGQRLFQFAGDDGEPHAIDSEMVNDYLAQIAGGAFTAKDFRTWGATLRAVELLARTAPMAEASERARKACENDVVARVAADLRNTPAVCRKSYINPEVFAWWRDGRLQAAWAHCGGGHGRRAERVTIALLRNGDRARARAAPGTMRGKAHRPTGPSCRPRTVAISARSLPPPS